MRMAVQADQGHILLKLNDQNMEDDVTITQEDLNTWKIKILHGKLPNSTRKSQVDKESSICEKHCLGVDVIDRCRKCDILGKTT